MTQPTTPKTLSGGTAAVPTSRPRGGMPRDRRPLATVMFAVIAVGLVVAGGTLLQLQRNGRSAGNIEDTPIEPAEYALQATGDVSDLAELSPVSQDALASLDGADDAAVAALQQAIDDAVAQLEGALAAAALPGLPEAGSDIEVELDAVEDVAIPQLPVPDLGLDALRVRDVVVSASPVGPRAGTPLDDALAQVEGLQAQLDDLLGETAVGGLVGELPAGLGPIAPPGGAPQASEAGDTVDPDEDGAASASAHAQAALGLASGAFDGTVGELETLLALYEELVAKVEDALELIEQTSADGKDDLEALLEERLADVESKVADLESEADRLIDEHEAAVGHARGTLEDAVKNAAVTQSSAVRAAGEATLRDLQAQATALQAEADGRRRDIAAIVTTASLELGEGPEALQALQAIEAAAAVADLQVERDLASRLAAIEMQTAEAQALVDQAQAQLGMIAAQAMAEANATLGDAVAGDSDVHAYLVAVAQEYGVQMAARETEAVNEAMDLLEEQATQLSQDVLDEALDGAGASQLALARVGEVVDGAEWSLMQEVGKDLEYVSDVAEDYSRVPTEDRKARASYWTGLALDLEESLQQVVVEGRDLESLARDVLDAAEDAEAELQAMT